MKKFTSSHSSGATATRTSENRTYAFAVWAFAPAALLIARQKEAIEYNDKKATEYRANEAAGGNWYQHTPSYRVFITTEENARYAESSEKNASRLRNELAAGIVDESPYVVGWTSRRDLAEKLASQNRGRGLVVEIAEAVTVEEKPKKPRRSPEEKMTDETEQRLELAYLVDGLKG